MSKQNFLQAFSDLCIHDKWSFVVQHCTQVAQQYAQNKNSFEKESALLQALTQSEDVYENKVASMYIQSFTHHALKPLVAKWKKERSELRHNTKKLSEVEKVKYGLALSEEMQQVVSQQVPPTVQACAFHLLNHTDERVSRLVPFVFISEKKLEQQRKNCPAAADLTEWETILTTLEKESTTVKKETCQALFEKKEKLFQWFPERTVHTLGRLCPVMVVKDVENIKTVSIAYFVADTILFFLKEMIHQLRHDDLLPHEQKEKSALLFSLFYASYALLVVALTRQDKLQTLVREVMTPLLALDPLPVLHFLVTVEETQPTTLPNFMDLSERRFGHYFSKQKWKKVQHDTTLMKKLYTLGFCGKFIYPGKDVLQEKKKNETNQTIKNQYEVELYKNTFITHLQFLSNAHLKTFLYDQYVQNTERRKKELEEYDKNNNNNNTDNILATLRRLHYFLVGPILKELPLESQRRTEIKKFTPENGFPAELDRYVYLPFPDYLARIEFLSSQNKNENLLHHRDVGQRAKVLNDMLQTLPLAPAHLRTVFARVKTSMANDQGPLKETVWGAMRFLPESCFEFYFKTETQEQVEEFLTIIQEMVHNLYVSRDIPTRTYTHVVQFYMKQVYPTFPEKALTAVREILHKVQYKLEVTDLFPSKRSSSNGRTYFQQLFRLFLHDYMKEQLSLVEGKQVLQRLLEGIKQFYWDSVSSEVLPLFREILQTPAPTEEDALLQRTVIPLYMGLLGMENVPALDDYVLHLLEADPDAMVLAPVARHVARHAKESFCRRYIPKEEGELVQGRFSRLLPFLERMRGGRQLRVYRNACRGLYFGGCSSAVQNWSSTLQEQLGQQLIHTMNTQASLRQEAFHLLKHLPCFASASVPQLIQMVKENELLREFAIQLLGTAQDKASLPYLLQLLESVETAKLALRAVRGRFTLALRRLPEEKKEEGIRQMIQDLQPALKSPKITVQKSVLEFVLNELKSKIALNTVLAFVQEKNTPSENNNNKGIHKDVLEVVLQALPKYTQYEETWDFFDDMLNNYFEVLGGNTAVVSYVTVREVTRILHNSTFGIAFEKDEKIIKLKQTRHTKLVCFVLEKAEALELRELQKLSPESSPTGTPRDGNNNNNKKIKIKKTSEALSQAQQLLAALINNKFFFSVSGDTLATRPGRAGLSSTTNELIQNFTVSQTRTGRTENRTVFVVISQCRLCARRRRHLSRISNFTVAERSFFGSFFH
ncbi:hypothetical protein ADEAN_000940400 [Angomonas deanei]|uniref:Uncharacterized protein n=1 Tax=Angomonas deanei TaxID=59799 RepID=A0A7G2CR62_9TRYP|nr:hypothetical protein ADEAN_000940400 [Angomonas deanei]